MALLGMREVVWGFAYPPLLENITFQIERGERVCLVGRNAVGKSTLFKLLSGALKPDSGEVWRQQGVQVACLDQTVPTGFKGTIFDVVAGGLGAAGNALAQYNRLNPESEKSLSPADVDQRDTLHHQLETSGGWELLGRIEGVLAHTGLDPKQDFGQLSAGMQRRALFARALTQEPDVLLLDEPTNHLDITTIQWLETHIRRRIKTLLFITHDRAFLRQIANRIIELDRGRLFSYDCDYAAYLTRREAARTAAAKQNARFDKKLSQEEAWIRQGIKARRTRNEGRVRALKKMRAAYRARRKEMGQAKLRIQEAERTGKLVIEAKQIAKAHGGRPLIENFSTMIMRGDKVGLIGPNGVGKSTLLRILLKEDPPDRGQVRHGTRLKVAYFDQLRDQLDQQQTVQANIAEGNNYVTVNGARRHVISYLKDFLFSPERCRTPIHVLSGGEQNRLLLAKLFLRPANVLVMDEPTNDLDMETLELLEELLFNYAGTLLLVSHDRDFLNNVVTSTIVFEGRGRLQEYAGGYDDWLSQKAPDPPLASRERKGVEKKRPKPSPKRKLTFKEKFELEALPPQIDAWEEEQQALYACMADPQFFKGAKEEIREAQSRLTEIEAAIAAGYRRWEELEQIAEERA